MLRVASTHETWTITSKTRKNLEAAEMWFYRRIPRIPWTAHQTNVSVLQRMGQERKLLCCIEQNNSNFWTMLYAKESSKILLWVVKSQENVQGVPNVLLSSITLKVCAKILELMGDCT